MGWMQSNGGVHIAVAMAKVSSWIVLMQTNGGVHMGTNTIATATTQCEQALRLAPPAKDGTPAKDSIPPRVARSAKIGNPC